ncbi:MAG: type II toxin-antitoxin system RelE/ParE family toxin [Rhizobiales bacterium]|nr:type II toxin-antitoxin system RelE/ParE family toxin [Hyphomicrobiales bacterium]
MPSGSSKRAKEKSGSRSSRSNGSSAWTIEFTEDARRQIKKLDPQWQRAITRYLDESVLPLLDPRLIGEGLQENMAGYWRYRVGAYRIICEIEDHRLVILVIKIGHRREVYR